MTATRFLAIFASLLLLSALVDSSTSLRPRRVRIDHHDVATHPDLVVETPIFSWSLDDETCTHNGTAVRGIRQTAYQLIVTREMSFYSPTQTSSIIYDSGRILSDRSTNILYEGPALISDTRYSYSIQYWSSTGAVSQPVTGHFRTALFFPRSELTGSWIGSRQINMNELRREFNVPKGIQAATVFMSGMGYGILYLNGVDVDPSRRFDPGWTTYTQRVLYVSYDVTRFLTGESTSAHV